VTPINHRGVVTISKVFFNEAGELGDAGNLHSRIISFRQSDCQRLLLSLRLDLFAPANAKTRKPS
jgi:hypothetical protein